MEFIYEEFYSKKESCLVSETEVVKTYEILRDYVAFLNEVSKNTGYEFPESCINIPFDEKITSEVVRIKEILVQKPPKYIIDVGIGGSNLGTKAIYDGVFGYFDILEPKRFPKMIFVDTNDAAFLEKLEVFLDKEIKSLDEIVINTVCKSGETTETILNTKLLLSLSPKIKERMVITTNVGSKLWDEAKIQGISLLSIPEKVGGRFSVLTAVGLFPILLSGLDIMELVEGSMEITSKCLNGSLLENPAVLSAIITFLNYKNGKSINDIFIFHPELESLGKWQRQLMAESLGKNGVGITPTVSIGSTDLHSVEQLYIGGPKDKFTTFVSGNLHNNPSNESSNRVINAIFKGVKTSYIKNGLPFVEIIFDKPILHSIGEFFQFKMFEIMYIAKLMNVNAFNQPNVEAYKAETKKSLSQL